MGTNRERIAILRFENLSGDASLSWEGRAFSEVLSAELGSGPDAASITSARLHSFDRAMGVRPISAPGISSENQQALAAGAARIGYGEYTVRNGRLEARLFVEDSRTRKMVKVAEASAPAGDVLGAAAALARQIMPRPAPAPTRSPEALMLYTKALEAGSAADMEQGLTGAIAADPDFVGAYHLMGQLRVQQGNRAGAVALAEQALARKSISELDRARLELELAEWSGNVSERRAALLKLTRLDPSEVSVWRALGETAMNRHDYREAMQAYQKGSGLEPENPELLNLLGYAAVHAGSLEAGMAALRRYQALRPNDSNPFDSMGDINFAAGRLAEAESFYLQAQKKDRALLADGDLAKAAIARLLTGDTEGAGKIAEQYFEARASAKDLLVENSRAQWSWITGHRKEALERMEAFAKTEEQGSMRDVAARSWADACLWNLLLGNREAAAQEAQKASALGSKAAVGNVLVARFLAMPPAPAQEWAVRAEQQFPSPGEAMIKNFSLAHALLINREFGPAQVLLKQMWDSSTPSADEGLQVKLAWSYLETGKVKEAAPFLRENPIPPAGFAPYMTFYVPRLFYLRGMLAEKEGRRQDAREQYQKFLKLSPSSPLIWGEEEKARAAM